MCRADPSRKRAVTPTAYSVSEAARSSSNCQSRSSTSQTS
eukprot:gene16740-16919_t